MMGTQQRHADHHQQQHGHSHSHGVIQSSITLLQERFKQLQRVREMREKKELLRIFSNHNYVNNNNTSTTILSTSNSTTITTSTATNSNNFNSSNNIPTDAAMHYNNHHEPYSNDRHHDDGDGKELQVFLPPNYYNYKPSCYPSPSSSSSPPPSSSTSLSSSSSSSSDNNHGVSLSLWPSTPPPCNVTATADRLQRTTNFTRPSPMKDQAMGRPCVTKAFKFEDSNHHVSDVDTTLHL